jgi:hypothetical protein
MTEPSVTPEETLVRCFDGSEVSPWWHMLADAPAPLGFAENSWMTLTNRQRGQELLQSIAGRGERAPQSLCQAVLGREECSFAALYEKLVEPADAAEEWQPT